MIYFLVGRFIPHVMTLIATGATLGPIALLVVFVLFPRLDWPQGAILCFTLLCGWHFLTAVLSFRFWITELSGYRRWLRLVRENPLQRWRAEQRRGWLEYRFFPSRDIVTNILMFGSFVACVTSLLGSGCLLAFLIAPEQEAFDKRMAELFLVLLATQLLSLVVPWLLDRWGTSYKRTMGDVWIDFAENPPLVDRRWHASLALEHPVDGDAVELYVRCKRELAPHLSWQSATTCVEGRRDGMSWHFPFYVDLPDWQEDAGKAGVLWMVVARLTVDAQPVEIRFDNLPVFEALPGVEPDLRQEYVRFIEECRVSLNNPGDDGEPLSD